MSEDAITTHQLGKSYGRHQALSDLDLRVRSGEVYGLIGPNGAGKTTAMRLLLDIIRPSTGTLQVLGEDPRQGGARLRRRIGFLPGDLRLAGHNSSRTLLQHLASLSGPVAPETVPQLAKRLDLDLNRPFRTLSKGNRQKTGLIQAFMHEPDLLVLDEPTSGLDPLLQQEFLELVDEARSKGQTVILSSHVLSEIEQVADRVGILRDGRLLREDTVSGLRQTRLRRVRASISDSGDVRARLERLPDVHQLQLKPDGDELHLNLLLEGDVNPLIRLLAEFEVHNLLIEEPMLEEAVLDLYREDNQ